MIYLYLTQGSQYRTVPAGTADVYRTGKQISTINPPISYRKKYRPVPGVPASTEKSFFYYYYFLSFVIFEFLLGQNGNLFALTY